MEPGFSLSKKGKAKKQEELYGVKLKFEYGCQCELMIPNT